MSEEEIIKDIKETNYNEKDVEKLLYELKNDTDNYSCYDIAIAILYYKELYNKEKEKHKDLSKRYDLLQLCYENDISNSISKDKIRELIKDNSFEVYTKEYGNIDVIDLDSLNELLEE